MLGNYQDWMMGISININPTRTRPVPNTVIPKETMIDTMIGHGTLPMAQDYVQIVQTLLVIALETEAMCTKDLIRNGYGIKKETETTVPLVKESDHEIQIDAIIMIGDLPRKNHNESVIGQNTSVRPARNIITIANQKSLSGRSLVTGLIGKRKKNTSGTGSVTDVIEIVIVKENMIDSLTHHLGTVVVARLKDIPILVVLVLCRIVTITVAVVII